MIARSRTVLLALLGAVIGTQGAWAADITRGGKPAELTVTPGGAHSVRVTLKPIGVDLPPSPSLTNLEIKNPAISLKTIDGGGGPVKAHVGTLDVEVTASPLTVVVKGAGGRTVQTLVFDEKTGNVSFNIGNGPVLGLGEGGQQPTGRGGALGPQFDRRGKMDPMRPGWGSGTLGSRNPIAVLEGTDGWGLFVASPWVQVDLRDAAKGIFIPSGNATPTAGARGPVQTQPQLALELQPFDAFIFDAAQPADMMKDLHDLTGAAAMPPKWALGYQQSHRELRDANMTPEQLILSEIDTFRQKQIPIDSVVYLGTGFTPTGWNTQQPSFNFNPRVFSSDPKEVLKKMHDKNVKVIVHMVDLTPREMPHIVGNIPPLPDETLDQNHILPYWKRHEPLIAAGVDGFWPDEGDRFSIFERMTREKMYYQGGLMTTPNVRPWTINRNGVIGMSQWGAWMWSGDTQSRWNTLRDQIWIGQNVGLSITPYWGSDTGGFYTTSELTGELYTRWFEFSAFNGSFRSHGRVWRLHTPYGWGQGDMGFLEGQTDLPPASEMNNAAIEPITKKYDELRYQLMPYTYTLSREAFDTGMPLMRALWLHYPTDKQAIAESQEYLWGRDMLIAPVYEKGVTSRDVYLPAGTWYDFWDNTRQEGGKTVKRAVDLATMPIFVRAGAIIPVDPVRQYMAQAVTDATTLKVYSGASGEFTMYDDDGTSQDYMQNKGTWTKLSWDDAGKKLTITAAPPAGVTNQSSAPREFKVQMMPAGTVKTVTYDGRRAEVTF